MGGDLEVVGGVDADHARHVLGVVDLDAVDRGVSDGRADEVDVAETLDLHVVEVLLGALEERGVLSAEDGVAEDRSLHGGHERWFPLMVVIRTGGV